MIIGSINMLLNKLKYIKSYKLILMVVRAQLNHHFVN